MTASPPRKTPFWQRVSTRFLPFADVASETLPLRRLLRLALFQVSVGMALVLLTGTVNRVMIVELGVPAWLVALMIGLPLVFAPFRALIGHRSDTHSSVLGWRRVPFIWFGSVLQFGGLGIMPFSLILLSGGGYAPDWMGPASAALAFLLVGAGLHTTQTAGLALATDLATEDARPRVVALLYTLLLVGMGVSALVFGLLLSEYSHQRLVQVIQGAAFATIVLNLIALWKQEGRDPAVSSPDSPRQSFSEAWQSLVQQGRSVRLLVAVGLGAAAFSMQEALLEPYGGEVLGLSVSQTTLLTALFAAGSLVGFAWCARALSRGGEPHRLAGFGAVAGIVAFAAVIFAAPLDSAGLFCGGVALIGFGGGLYSVGTLTAAMDLARGSDSGIALGAWGAVQATAAGLAIAFGGAVRDLVQMLVSQGTLGPAMSHASSAYGVVYHIEILLLFAAILAIGPLAQHASQKPIQARERFGLAAYPG